MQPYGASPGQPPKKGTSTLTIVLIILGGIVVLGLGTCAVCVGVVRHETKELAAAIRDGGGLVTESPPEVKAALLGPKSAYVGTWTGTTGGSLAIESSGRISIDKHGQGSNRTTLSGLPIAAFQGDDIVLREIVVITLHVTHAPHPVGGHQEMIVDGVTYTRP
jgi:hypothetical protein